MTNEEAVRAFETEHRAVQKIWNIIDAPPPEGADRTVTTDDVVRMVEAMKTEHDDLRAQVKALSGNIQWSVNVLLEKIAANLEGWPTWDIWRSDAAMVVRGYKNDTTPPKWIAVDEVGNDNFRTSIYENDHKGLLIARCNQNGEYPWQGRAIIRMLEMNKAA